MAVTATYGQGILPANLTYDINEAYAVLMDAEKRRKYSKNRSG